jgi:hypothetical protein
MNFGAKCSRPCKRSYSSGDFPRGLPAGGCVVLSVGGIEISSVPVGRGCCEAEQARRGIMIIDEARREHHSAVTQLLQAIIRQSEPFAARDVVADALLRFLTRACLTRRSIDVIVEHCLDSGANDACALLRCIWDAYIQAAYIVFEPSESASRANSYRDYQHVERRQLAHRVLDHDTPVSRDLKSRSGHDQHQAAVEEEFERAKSRFMSAKGKLWNKWYSEGLPGIAGKLGIAAEHDMLVWHLHGSVHSSYLTSSGPLLSIEYVPAWADFITARIAHLSVSHNGFVLTESERDFLESLAFHKFV